jgi:hypothetical protein
MIQFREENIDGIPIYAWSRPRVDTPNLPGAHRANEYQIIVRDQATVYEAHGPQPITDVSRDQFVGLVAVLRTTRPGMTWPFYGRGITDAGPSPWGENGWFVPASLAELRIRD